MLPESSERFLDLLAQAREGHPQAEEQLFLQLYDELRSLARHMLCRERPGHSVQATALVHEVYLRLFSGSTPQVRDRKHFMAIAGHVMRRLLVDRIRRKQAAKRCKESPVDEHDEIEIAGWASPEIMLDVDRAMDRLERLSPRTARIVEWRYFVGLTEDEIAELLEVSYRTVRRDLQMAKSFLSAELGGGGEGAGA